MNRCVVLVFWMSCNSHRNVVERLASVIRALHFFCWPETSIICGVAFWFLSKLKDMYLGRSTITFFVDTPGYVVYAMV